MPYEPPPELAALTLAQIAELTVARKLPPVGQWDPQASSDSLMRIAADGRWFHDGGEIKRAAMVRAFASLLRCDADGQHWLVTPHEKQSIEVADAAFVAVDLVRQGDALVLRLNTDDLVIAGPEHPLIVRGTSDLPAVYLAVRHGTEARLNRSTWLQLVELAGGDLTVASQGTTFALAPQ
jgi:uncharacterized protein